MSLSSYLSSIASFGGSPSHNVTTHHKTAIDNVRVFDGHRLLPPGTVIIDGDRIGRDPHGAVHIDGHGSILLPGFIDAHVHLNGLESLSQSRQYGITTMLDMGTFPYSKTAALQNQPGYPQVFGTGAAATVNGSVVARISPTRPLDSYVSNPAAAKTFVAARVAEGADYIKLIIDDLGPDEATIQTLVKAAHANGKKVISHAPSFNDYTLAELAGVDIVTHAPLDKPLDAQSIDRLVDAKRVVVPTLVIMQQIASIVPGGTYPPARDSVTAMFKAGVPMIVGTDANVTPGVPNPPYGLSFHQEMEHLVEAGLSTVQVLRAATVVGARHFGLKGRGRIRPGYRADLVMVEGDPIADIRAAREVRRVWCGGVMTEFSSSAKE